MLTPEIKIRELLAHYSKAELADLIGITGPTLATLMDGTASDLSIFKLDAAWDSHVHAHSVDMTMAEFVDHGKNGGTIMVDTPDGYHLVKTIFEKKSRPLIKLSTVNHTLTCSNDHLVETSIGWVKAESAQAAQLLTRTGLELASLENLPPQPVWDFEVDHENHRYWGGTGISSHNSGKSFILCNALKNAQADGAFIFILDSENALDVGWLKRIGMDISEDKFFYAGVTTFSDVVKVVSEFIANYEKTYGRDNPDSPQVVIALDSLDMLITDTENDHFDSGVQKGDQGQRAKQSKHMLRTLVSRIKRNPMAFCVTHQVYPNTDMMNGQGMWIVNNAIKYSASQILLITPAKLKEGTEIVGVRMKVETYKSRFAKIGQRVEVEVPWDAGMNPYSGLLDMMVELGVVKAAGAWKSLELPGQDVIKFQTKHLDADLVAKILSHPLVNEDERNVLQLMDDPDTWVAEEVEVAALVADDTEEALP